MNRENITLFRSDHISNSLYVLTQLEEGILVEVRKIRKNRRNGKDRRQNNKPYNGPERRSGKDRRNLDKRLKEMIKQDEKERTAKERIISKSGNSKVIRRRKIENNNPPTSKQGENDEQS